jgi:hypothetical protein
MRRPSPALVISVIALFVALGGVGVAANGGDFILGLANTANGTSSLTGTSAGAQLAVSNSATNSTARALSLNGSSPAAALIAHNSSGPAAAFQSPSNVAPFNVNSTQKVASLNADLLDGLDSTAFQRRISGSCAAGSAIREVTTNGSVTCQATGSGANMGVYNATTSDPPTITTLGTFLGDTIGAQCVTSGSPTLFIYLKTTDGSWTYDFDQLADTGAPNPAVQIGSRDHPAGTYSSPTVVDSVSAPTLNQPTFDKQVDFLQSAPSPGFMTWHESVAQGATGPATCHLSVQAIPETLSTTSG